MHLEGEQKLQRELEVGEHFLWTGVPRQGIRLQLADLILIPFSLVWGGFAFFWEYSVLTTEDAPLFFALFGIPFVLIGAQLMVGRFFSDARRRSRTYYALTNRRILIVTELDRRDVLSLALRGLEIVMLKEKSGGRGTLVFGASSILTAPWQGTGWPGSSDQQIPCFEEIERVRQVYQLATETQQRLPPDTA